MPSRFKFVLQFIQEVVFVLLSRGIEILCGTSSTAVANSHRTSAFDHSLWKHLRNYNKRHYVLSLCLTRLIVFYVSDLLS